MTTLAIHGLEIGLDNSRHPCLYGRQRSDNPYPAIHALQIWTLASTQQLTGSPIVSPIPASSDPGVVNVRLGVSYEIHDAALVGEYDVAADYTDPGEANVLAGVSYLFAGVTMDGALDESLRNIDPGVANVLDGIVYRILDVPLTGTFDEDARNTDPGADNVIKDVAYKIKNDDKVGVFDEAARNTDPGVANVILGTGYKILNASKTGTYDPDRDPPGLAYASFSVGETSVVATLTAVPTDADLASIRLRYRALLSGTAWTTGGTFSTNAVGGTVTVSGLTTGRWYVAIVESLDASGNYSAPGTIYLFAPRASSPTADLLLAYLEDDLLNVTGVSAAYAGRAHRPVALEAGSCLVALESREVVEQASGAHLARYRILCELARRQKTSSERQSHQAAATAWEDALRERYALRGEADLAAPTSIVSASRYFWHWTVTEADYDSRSDEDRPDHELHFVRAYLDAYVWETNP